MVIGEKVFINENARTKLGLPDGVIYIINDILKDDVPYNIVLGAVELGSDYVQFFRKDELIDIPNNLYLKILLIQIIIRIFSKNFMNHLVKWKLY